jgi:hypothetical protein
VAYTLQPWQVFLTALAGWITRHQQAAIDFLREENRVLLNAWIERFMRSIKSECLDRMIFFGEDSLRRAVREYVAHYHAQRNHQGLCNAIIAPLPRPTRAVGRVRCRERLGGMLRDYHREAA